ncbi:MAG: enoyl-CoA hydratase-related protein [Gammaproteobacteria bacterium]
MNSGEFYLQREDIEHDLGKVCVFTVHGRTKINLVGSEALASMRSVIESAAADQSIRCAILQGKNEAALIGGADLKELGSLEYESADKFVGAIHHVCAAIRQFPVPVIARMQGYCLGGGLEIAAACDFRVADTSAQCGMPEVKVGVPSVVEAALLPQLIGWGKTRELVYRGNIIDAFESAKIGLIEQLATQDDIDGLIAECLADILEAAPGAIRIQKQLCAKWERLDIDGAVLAGLEAFKDAYKTDEPEQYVEAFFTRNRQEK